MSLFIFADKLYLYLKEAWNQLWKSLQAVEEEVAKAPEPMHKQVEFTRIKFDDETTKAVICDGLIFDVKLPRHDHKVSYNYWIENFSDKPLSVTFLWKETEIYYKGVVTKRNGIIINQTVTLDPKTNKDILWSATFNFPLVVYGRGWKWLVEAIVNKEVIDSYAIVADIDKGRLYSFQPDKSKQKLTQQDFSSRTDERIEILEWMRRK